jgi:hypothetical protein
MAKDRPADKGGMVYTLADQAPTLRDLKLLKRTAVNEDDQVDAIEELFQRWLVPTPTDEAMAEMDLPAAMRYVAAITAKVNEAVFGAQS